MPSTLHLQAAKFEDLQRAAEILCGGGLVALPTETVYGLGADALSPEAVARIFAAKRRPAWDPLIVHLAHSDRLEQVAQVTPTLAARVQALVTTFWPGPLTLLLQRQPAVSDVVTAGRDKVGVRVPAHPVARQLLQLAGRPIAAPSANRFGHTSPTTAEHVLADLGGSIEAVLDAGPCTIGVESTVLDPTQTPMVIYRAGAVSSEELQRLTGVEVVTFEPVAAAAPLLPAALPSPGVGLRHYAPEVPLWLSEGEEAALWRRVNEGKAEAAQVGVLLPRDWALNRSRDWLFETAAGLVVQPWGVWADKESLARELFSSMRSLEEAKVHLMVAPLPLAGGLGDALRDRLLKAAKPRLNASGC